MQLDYAYMLDALRATPATLDALLSIYTPEQAHTRRTGDEWSVVEVVCHLRDNEERVLERVRSMRDSTEPLLTSYDQERWAIERNYAAADLREAFTDFVRFREQHVAELSALAAADWGRAGQHPERGRITIGSQILRLACHDAVHTAQIARQLAGYRSG